MVISGTAREYQNHVLPFWTVMKHRFPNVTRSDQVRTPHLDEYGKNQGTRPAPDQLEEVRGESSHSTNHSENLGMNPLMLSSGT